MVQPRPSNLLILAFVLIFASLVIFLFGAIIFNAKQQVEESPETFDNQERELLD